MKTTYRPTSFRTQLSFTFRILISVSTRPSWRESYIAMSGDNNVKVEGLDIPACYMRIDPGKWSDVYSDCESNSKTS